MNVLIVDDNATNRMLMEALLDDYMELYKGITFSIDTAVDGQDAVDKCSSSDFDLVFMDINMPNMDGVEASKIIRSRDSKIMIIAVSAAEDAEKRAEILNNGAEDYIPKPVDVDIFNSRLKNYILLSESRNKENLSSHEANLYTNKIYSRHTMFLLDSEDSIAEFWEFFLLNARCKSNHLSDVIRIIVDIADKQMKFSDQSKVYIEESEDKQYMTLANIDVLPKQMLKLILKKNSFEDSYKFNDKKISFELIKSKQYEDEEEIPVVMPTTVKKEVSKVNVTIDYTSNKLEVFDYIDTDDLTDLEEYSDNLNSLMLLVGGGALEENDIVEMCGYLDRISNILSPYSEIYPISHAFSSLSMDLSTHIEEFTKNSEVLGPMCSAFSNDLLSWIRQSFHDGAPSIDFMNDTISVNAQTIANMLKIDEAPPASDDDFDDIFDF